MTMMIYLPVINL